MKNLISMFLNLLVISLAVFGQAASADVSNRGFVNRIDIYNFKGHLTKNVPVQIAMDDSNLPFLFSESPIFLNMYFIEDQNGKAVANNTAAVRFFFDVSSGRVTAIKDPSTIDYKQMCIQLEGDVYITVRGPGGQPLTAHKIRRVLGSQYQTGANVSLNGPDECSLN